MEYNNVLTEVEFRKEYDYHKPESRSIRTQLLESVKCNGQCMLQFFISLFPIIKWLPKYSIKGDLPGDIIGGVTTAIVRIPQSLAYGMLAGLDPINGMYVAFFAPLTYVFLGTSKHVSVGTFAVISLMLGSALDKYLDANPFVPTTGGNSSTTIAFLTTTASSVDLKTTSSVPSSESANTESEYFYYKLTAVTSLTILVGLIQICLGLFRLGFVAVFLSDPLVSGFTTSAALFVFTAQLKYFFGINLSRQKAPFALVKTYIELFTRIGETRAVEVILSVIAIAILYPVKLINVKYKKKLRNIPIPIELIVVILATVISVLADLRGKFGVDVVGSIPSGLPAPRLPSASAWPSMIGDAFSIAVVGFAITVSIGKLFAKKHGYKISPNQELFALGASQITCGIFQGHACSGALARSTVKESSGTKTQFADIVSCIVILLVLLLIGQFLSQLPVACLSSIILVNVRGLLKQILILPKLWSLSKPDFVIWVVTYVAVILLGVDLGLAIGVLGLLVTVVLRVYKPHITVRGALGDTDIYRDIAKFKKAKEVAGVKVVRFPQSPFFGNVAALEHLSSEAMLVKRFCDEDQRSDRSAENEQERSLLREEPSDDGYVDVSMTQADRDESSASAQPASRSSDETSLNDTKEDHVVVMDTSTRDVHYGRANGAASRTTSSSPDRVSFDPDHCFHTIVFDCSGWTFIDLMGMETVRQVCQDFKEANLKVFLASVQPGIMAQLIKIGVIAENADEKGLVTVFPSVRFAVEAAKRSKCHQRFPAESSEA